MIDAIVCKAEWFRNLSVMQGEVILSPSGYLPFWLGVYWLSASHFLMATYQSVRAFPNSFQFVWCWFMEKQKVVWCNSRTKRQVFPLAYSLFGVDLWTDRRLYGNSKTTKRQMFPNGLQFGVDLWRNRRLYDVILEQRGRCFLMVYSLFGVD